MVKEICLTFMRLRAAFMCGYPAYANNEQAQTFTHVVGLNGKPEKPLRHSFG